MFYTSFDVQSSSVNRVPDGSLNPDARRERGAEEMNQSPPLQPVLRDELGVGDGDPEQPQVRSRCSARPRGAAGAAPPRRNRIEVRSDLRRMIRGRSLEMAILP